MKSMFTKALVLSVVALLAGASAQAAPKKSNFKKKKQVQVRLMVRFQKGLSSAKNAVSSRVAGVTSSGKSLFARAKGLAGRGLAAGWDYTKAGLGHVKNAAMATARFAKKPAQIALGLYAAKRLSNLKFGGEAYDQLAVDKAKEAYANRGEVKPYLKSKLQEARAYAASKRPSRNTLALGVLGIGAAYAAYQYFTAEEDTTSTTKPAKKRRSSSSSETVPASRS